MKGDRAMTGIMEYKGYRAKIEYSPEDEALIGKVLGITDILIFDGQSIKEIEEMFHASIDDYLELCRETGKKPEREYRGTFNVRVPAELHREISIAAQSKNVPLNQLVTDALRRYVAAETHH